MFCTHKLLKHEMPPPVQQSKLKLGTNGWRTACALFCFLLIGATSSQSRASCIELVQAKCISCHFETRVCQKLKKKKGKRSWKRTIKSMVRHGTDLNNAEQKKLVQCFVKRDPEILTLCKMKK